MSLRDKFSRLIEDAVGSVEYWRDIAITDFTRDLHDRMRQMHVTHAELARRMGTSRPYVTKLLEGGNFTLETMVKLATALGGVVRVHIADRDALTHWEDEISSEEEAPSDSEKQRRTTHKAQPNSRGCLESPARAPLAPRLIQPRQGRQVKARGRSVAETPGKKTPKISRAPAGATGEPGS